MTGQTAFGVAGQVGARRDPANRVDEHVSGRDQLTVLRLHARIRFVESDGERHGTGHVLRARAQAAFLPASGQHRFDGCAAAYQQRSQTFGGAEFVSGYGQGVHIPVTKTNRNLPGGLYGVYMDGHAVRVGDADQFLHGFHGADLVVGQHGGDHRGTFTGLAVELAFKCVEIENPMVPGQKVVAVPVPKIDTAIIHVQQASPDGTCIIMGDEFHDIDIAIAARKTIVTCEEIVSDEFIRRDPTKTRIFGECVQAVVKAPYGAWPAQCYDYYDDDDAGLKEYDKASKYQDAEDAVKQLEKAAAKAAKALEKAPEDEKLKLAAENAQKAFELAKSGEKIPETFKDFLEKWVYSCEDQSALLDKLGGSRLMRLKNEPHLGYSTTH